MKIADYYSRICINISAEQFKRIQLAILKLIFVVCKFEQKKFYLPNKTLFWKNSVMFRMIIFTRVFGHVLTRLYN